MLSSIVAYMRKGVAESLIIIIYLGEVLHTILRVFAVQYNYIVQLVPKQVLSENIYNIDV